MNNDAPYTLSYPELDEDGFTAFFTNMFHYEGTVLRDIIPQLTFSVLFSALVYLLQLETQWFNGANTLAVSVFGTSDLALVTLIHVIYRGGRRLIVC